MFRYEEIDPKYLSGEAQVQDLQFICQYWRKMSESQRGVAEPGVAILYSL